eukprot:COSAG04_NODE_13223_length_614_cov_7.077670_2_plen_56_part_01
MSLERLAKIELFCCYRREQTVAMDVDEVDNTTHAPPACNLSAPALCAPTMGYYGGD